MVLFTWKVTEPISNIPCVIEVNTSPDMDPSSYAGELVQTGAWYRTDADDHDRNTRNGLSRMIVVGHSVNLAADQQHYYRLQCGGDTRTGTFRTLSERTAASDRTIAYTMHESSATKLAVEFGTAYSRTTDQITDAESVTRTCGKGETCSVSIRVPAGAVAYFRCRERDGSGVVLRSGIARPLEEFPEEDE
jgi:hypothetical protein